MFYLNSFGRRIGNIHRDLLAGQTLPLRAHDELAKQGICKSLAIEWLMGLHDGLSLFDSCDRISGKLIGQSKSVTNSLHRQFMYQDISITQHKTENQHLIDTDGVISIRSHGMLKTSRTVRISSFDKAALGNNLEDLLCYSNFILVALSPINHSISIGNDKYGQAGLFDPNHGVIKIKQKERIGDIINSTCQFYKPCYELYIRTFRRT